MDETFLKSAQLFLFILAMLLNPSTVLVQQNKLNLNFLKYDCPRYHTTISNPEVIINLIIKGKSLTVSYGKGKYYYKLILESVAKVQH